MQEPLFKIRYFERGLSQNLKNSTLFILSKPIPGQGYEKQKGPKTSDQSLFSGYKTSSEKFLY